MDWSDVGRIAAKAAPLIGSVLGPGGAAVGGLIASALGVDSTPDAVAQALQAHPDAAVKLRQIEADHEVQLQQLSLQARAQEMAQQTSRLASINRTMRAELGSDNLFLAGWRPMIGWVMALSMGAMMLSLVYAIFITPARAPAIVSSATVIISLMLTVLGVSVTQRSKDKQTHAGIIQPGILQAVASRIRGGAGGSSG